jgi:hypothetical protein
MKIDEYEIKIFLVKVMEMENEEFGILLVRDVGDLEQK